MRRPDNPVTMEGGERVVEPFKPLYTVKEASRILMVNSDAVRSYIKQKRLPAIQLGSIKIRGSDLEQFIMTFPTVGSDEGGTPNETTV